MENPWESNAKVNALNYHPIFEIPHRWKLRSGYVKTALLRSDFITVSSAWELTSVSMRYSQGDEVNTSLSKSMYCTHV